MTLRAEVLQAMKDAGASVEVILAAVKAEQVAERAEVAVRDAERREKAAAKKRRQRAATAVTVEMSPDVPGTDGDEGGQSGTLGDSKKEGPQTPIENTPPTVSPSESPSEAPSAAVPAEIDPRKDLFDRGVPAVRRMTGRAEPGCRSLVGRWLGLAQDSAVIVMTTIDEACERELAAPIPWIEQTIRNEVQRNGSGRSDLFTGRPAGRQHPGSSFDSVVAGMADVAARRGLRPGGRQNGGGQDHPRGHQARPDDPEIEDAHWAPAAGHRAAHH